MARIKPTLLLLAIVASQFPLISACQSGYVHCQPSGATASALPPVGTSLASLYGDLLDSVKGIEAPPEVHMNRPDGTGDGNIKIKKKQKHRVEREKETRLVPTAEDGENNMPQICCISGTDCLNLQQFNIPFCYDRFTTNFVLADGSTGTLDSGHFTPSNGPSINLVSGGYNFSGISCNIYSASSPPNPATLPIPTPYTASGIGGPIPLTALAGLETITTTVPGTTIAPSTIPGSEAVSEEMETAPQTTTVTITQTIPPSTIVGTTIPPTTITYTTSTPLMGSTTGATSSAGGVWVVAPRREMAALEMLVLGLVQGVALA